MKLLLIEDDAGMVLTLRRGLRHNCLVEAVGSGVEGLHEAEVGEYDVIVLDLVLPDMLGLMVCHRLRQRQITTPILVLSGRHDTRDKVMLLDAGANDYLTKPFSLEELQVRLRVLVRSATQPSPTSQLVVGDLKLDMATRQVRRLDTPIKLRRKEYALLEYLMRNVDTVVTRAMIIDHVWDAGENLWTNAVDVHIKYLRDQIDRPFDEPLIKTVHGVGYMLGVPKVETAPEEVY